MENNQPKIIMQCNSGWCKDVKSVNTSGFHHHEVPYEIVNTSLVTPSPAPKEESGLQKQIRNCAAPGCNEDHLPNNFVCQNHNHIATPHPDTSWEDRLMEYLKGRKDVEEVFIGRPLTPVAINIAIAAERAWIREKVEKMKLGKPNLRKGHPEYQRCCEDNEINDYALNEVLKLLTKEE